MAEKAEQIGVEKTRFEITRLLALAVLAGAFVAFGSLFSVVVTAGAEGVLPYGVTRLLGGLVFSLGLILVIVGGAELFTGNNLMVMACASGRVSPGELLRAWGLVYAGYFVGATGLALLVFAAAGYDHGGGIVGCYGPCQRRKQGIPVRSTGARTWLLGECARLPCNMVIATARERQRTRS